VPRVSERLRHHFKNVRAIEVELVAHLDHDFVAMLQSEIETNRCLTVSTILEVFGSDPVSLYERELGS
jgi:restriction endonuclease